MIARRATRTAIVDATDATHASLRAAYGLTPGSRSNARADVRAAASDLGYVGHEFRVYPYMRVSEATRFIAAIHRSWDPVVAERYFEIAGIGSNFEIRRLKRAYQRALVLCYALAGNPARLVIENAEEFDEPGTRALLASAIASAPDVVVTYGAGAEIDRAWYDAVVAANEYDVTPLARAR